MSKIIKQLCLSCCLLGMIPAATAAEPAPNATTRYRITSFHVKPEAEARWLVLQEKEVVPAMKKAGVPTRRLYHTVMGDNTEYLGFEPFPSYAALDGPDALEQALGKASADRLKQELADCLLGSTSHLELRHDALSYDPGNATVLFTSSYRAASGKNAEYLRFLHQHMNPPIKRAVDTKFIEGFEIMVSDQGGETGLFIMNMYYRDFATLEQGPPAAKMMTPEERTAFFAAGTGLIAPLGQIIREYIPAISY